MSGSHERIAEAFGLAFIAVASLVIGIIVGMLIAG